MNKKFLTRTALRLLSEVRNNSLVYILLGLSLVLGLFIRVYRIDELLGFYYDQGRDALTIWNIWHNRDIPFIGPTTGIAGIFRGPYYYYLIAPFYLLGRGNPVWPSVFLSITTILAVLVTYYLGYKIHSRTSGLIAAIISSFSFNIVMASRWLSNPTPMLLLSVLLVWMMILVTEKKMWAWPAIAFILGLSLFHFGSSGEVFYFLALVIFALWQSLPAQAGKNLPNKKIFLISLALFFITVLPLVAFDLKNRGLLIGNIRNFLFEGETTFGLPTWRHVGDKIDFLYDVFTNKIFHGRYVKENLLLATVFLFFIYYLHRLIKRGGVRILLLLLATGSLGIIFFQGNFGNIYDYYLTGYYLIFVLLFSVGLGTLWTRNLGKIFVLYFIYFFLINNTDVLKYKLTDKSDGPLSIGLKNQTQAVTWVYQDLGECKKFNLDVYVPPVIPYAYTYLFEWLGSSKYSCKPTEEIVGQLYTLYEVDPPHPERLKSWLDRQAGIGFVEKEFRTGGVVVQRRTRI